MKAETISSHSAFPAIQSNESAGIWSVEGLTKREHFAINILQGMAANKWFDSSRDVQIAVTTADALIVELNKPKGKSVHNKLPKIVCLCGSTRFMEAFQKANLEETLDGNIVLSVGCNTKSDSDLFAGMSETRGYRLKKDLDELHKRKIDLADEILVLNVGGYIGKSTQSEIEYAAANGKEIRYLEEKQNDTITN